MYLNFENIEKYVRVTEFVDVASLFFHKYKYTQIRDRNNERWLVKTSSNGKKTGEKNFNYWENTDENEHKMK